jgi:hypothetical protein
MDLEGPRRLSRALKEEPRPFAVGRGSTPGDEGEGLGGFTRRQHFNASFVTRFKGARLVFPGEFPKVGEPWKAKDFMAGRRPTLAKITRHA